MPFSNFVPSFVERRPGATFLSLLLVAASVFFTVRGGGNDTIIQKWEVQRKGGAEVGSGTVVAHMTSSGSLSLSGSLKVDGNMSGSTLNVNGTTRMGSGLIISRTTNIGWPVVAGADTACNTTCTQACVFGVNTASLVADIVDCADATADECLCAGN